VIEHSVQGFDAALATGTRSDELTAPLLGERDLFSVSEVFHENSKITPAARHFGLSTEAMRVAPDGFKRYVHAPRFALPAPSERAAAPLAETIAGRRSCRAFSGASISAAEVADLAFYCLGAQDAAMRRCLPSAGGLYPVELYVAAGAVDGLLPALYHYDPRGHALSLVAQSPPLPDVASAVFIPEAVEHAAAAVILTAVFGRSKIKYGERAYRFALLEAGHAMQNLCLTATALGLGSCPTGGFLDDALNDLMGVDGVEEAALYACILGVPA
jgi:SagB-type dehydrogenase family enzyme